MLTLVRHHRPLAALMSSALAGATLHGAVATFGSKAPASPEPLAAAARLSASGKIVDRLPGGASPASDFAGRLAWAGWTGAAAPFEAATLVAAAPGSPAVVEAAVIGRLASSVDAGTSVSRKQRPVHAAMRAHKVPVAVASAAALPPPRPASLRAEPEVIQVAQAKERHVSVTARVVALVGSLASLGGFL